MPKVYDVRTIKAGKVTCKALVPVFALYHLELGMSFDDAIARATENVIIGPRTLKELRVMCRQRTDRHLKRKDRHDAP